MAVSFRASMMAGALFAANRPAHLIGSCAAYARRDVFLTAAHCVTTDRNLYIQTPGDKTRAVLGRVIHPTADLAVLVTEPPNPDTEYLANQVYQPPANLLVLQRRLRRVVRC